MPRPGAGTSDAALRVVPADQDGALGALAESDDVMARLIKAFGPPDEVRKRRGRPPVGSYGALLRAIVGQQLSTKAARTIYGRLTDMFEGRDPTPAELIAADPEAIRACGLSRPKIGYLRDLAERIEDGDLDLERIAELPDERVVENLTAVKGLGRWTAEMFLMFHLGRPDVLPVGDLGIRRAAMIEYGLEEMPDPETLERLGERWRPYRSLACLYLWRSLDNDPG
jgi:DNA-3-methyladenine glycosylase II